MSKETITLVKRIPRKEHIIRAAYSEMPRLMIPALVLCVFWVSSFVLFAR